MILAVTDAFLIGGKNIKNPYDKNVKRQLGVSLSLTSAAALRAAADKLTPFNLTDLTQQLDLLRKSLPKKIEQPKTGLPKSIEGLFWKRSRNGANLQCAGRHIAQSEVCGDERCVCANPLANRRLIIAARIFRIFLVFLPPYFPFSGGSV